MLLDGLSHSLEGDCESATHHELCHSEHPNSDGGRMEQSDVCSVTYEDQKSVIFLVKEFEEVESSLILRDHTTSSGNQLRHDQTKKRTHASTTTSSSQSRKKMKATLGEGTGENHDGFQTPIKVMDMIPSTGLKCPPAPRKPMAKPLGKHERESRNLQVEFANEVELVLKLLSSEEAKKLKRARLAADEANGLSLGA